MYEIALVQNQSEMAHYGYADARSVIAELGYKVTLFTAQNVGDLTNTLRDGRTDGLVLGSNALNDKTIRAYFERRDLAEAIDEFLERGGGLLSFHQLRLAGSDNAKLAFLPSPLDQVTPVVRPTAETSASGSLVLLPATEAHTSLLYPNQVTAESLQERALGFKSLEGLYWHYWIDPDLADWDVLLADLSDGQRLRPLLLASKETSPYRVVLSALTLDWQRQREALQNVLAYVVEGRHNTAIISQSRSESQALGYLTASLEARRFPFQRYFLNEGLVSFDAHVESGVHTTIVLGDDVGLGHLRAASSVALDVYLAEGSIKFLSMDASDNPSRLAGVSVMSHQTEAHRFLALAELGVQAELRTGNIDGSFWSTAETLQILEGLPEVSTDYKPLVGRTLELAAAHDRDGSYDEVFGVTCALYWMRATYQGVRQPSTTSTEAWIRDRLSRFDTREQVLAYRTLAMTGLISATDREQLVGLLEALPHDQLSEIDLIAYIKAAVAAGIQTPLPSLVDQLLGALQDEWIDVATTASAATALLDARAALDLDPTSRGRIRRDLDDTIRRAVIALQDSMNHTSDGASSAAYPWEGKASTTVRCLEAWAKFDTQVAPPVYDVIDQLLGWDQVAAEIATTRTSLAVLDELKDENARLTERVANLMPRVRASDTELRYRRVLSGGLALAVYCIVALVIAAGSLDSATLKELLDQAFVKPLPIHIAVATLVCAAAVAPWHRVRKGQGKD